jgi:hypothetical protein
MDERPSTYTLLRDILNDVNHWLQFAEAKNAVLVTFDLALVVGIGTIASTGSNLPEFFKEISLITCGGLTISALMAMSSFFPSLIRFLDPETAGSNFTGNPFYFGDLATASGQTLLNALYSKSGGGGRGALDGDLANQIVTNSKITLRKFGAFTWALRVAGAFILFALIALSIEVLT